MCPFNAPRSFVSCATRHSTSSRSADHISPLPGRADRTALRGHQGVPLVPSLLVVLRDVGGQLLLREGLTFQEIRTPSARRRPVFQRLAVTWFSGLRNSIGAVPSRTPDAPKSHERARRADRSVANLPLFRQPATTPSTTARRRRPRRPPRRTTSSPRWSRWIRRTRRHLARRATFERSTDPPELRPRLWSTSASGHRHADVPAQPATHRTGSLQSGRPSASARLRADRRRRGRRRDRYVVRVRPIVSSEKACGRAGTCDSVDRRGVGRSRGHIVTDSLAAGIGSAWSTGRPRASVRVGEDLTTDNCRAHDRHPLGEKPQIDPTRYSGPRAGCCSFFLFSLLRRVHKNSLHRA